MTEWRDVSPGHASGSATAGPRFSRRSVLRAIVGGGAGLAVLAMTGCGGEAMTVIKMGDEMVFDPVTVTVRKGQAVTWKNSSKGMVHTATCDPLQVVDPAHVSRPDGAAWWHSGLLGRDESWSYTFDTVGEYRYCCVPHEMAGMLGTVIVTE